MQEQDSTRVAIYALDDPQSGEVRYIGQTRVPLDERLRAHVNGARFVAGAHGAWLRDLRKRGLAPSIRLLEMVEWEQANAAERHHIVAHVQRGCLLTNSMHNSGQNPQRRKERARWTWHGTVTLREEVGAEVERLAHQNGYPVSLMLRTLIREALAARAATVPAVPALTQEGLCHE